MIFRREEFRRSSLPNPNSNLQPRPLPTPDVTTFAGAEGVHLSVPPSASTNWPGPIPPFDPVPIMNIESRRSSAPTNANTGQPRPAPVPKAPATASVNSKVKGSNGDRVGQREKKQRQKEHGQPTTHDSLGRALYTRRSDGKLVYLRCLVQDCGRTDFKTVRALMRHVSDPRYAHKMAGIFKGNSHAIELCGVVAPGEDDLDSKASANRANSLVGDSQSVPIPRSRSRSTAVGSEDRVTKAKLIRDLERISQASPTVADTDLEMKKSRSQQAADLYEGFSSSDDEDDDETQLLREFSANKHHQQSPVFNGLAGSIYSPTGAEFSDAPTAMKQPNPNGSVSLQGCAAVDVKKEIVPSPPNPQNRSAISAEIRNSLTPPKTQTGIHLGPEIETDPEDFAAPTPAHGKRHAPYSPGKLRSREKRPRVSDGSSSP